MPASEPAQNGTGGSSQSNSTLQNDVWKCIKDSRTSELGSDMVDAVLLARGKEFRVHSFILSMRSEYFKAFFLNSLNMKVDMTGEIIEDQKIEQSKFFVREGIVPTIFNIDQDPEVLEKILQFIYGDEKCQEFETFELIAATFSATHLYMLTSYEEICAQILISLLNFTKGADIYNLAILFDNKTLLKKVRNATCWCSSDQEEPETEPCWITTNTATAGFNLDTFQDFFLHGSKNHPNDAINQLYEYLAWGQDEGEKELPEFPLEKLMTNIDWLKVESEMINLVNDQKYVTESTMINILFQRLNRAEDVNSNHQFFLRNQKIMNGFFDIYAKENHRFECNYGIKLTLHNTDYTQWCKEKECPVSILRRVSKPENIPDIKNELKSFKEYFKKNNHSYFCSSDEEFCHHMHDPTESINEETSCEISVLLALYYDITGC